MRVDVANRLESIMRDYVWNDDDTGHSQESWKTVPFNFSPILVKIYHFSSGPFAPEVVCVDLESYYYLWSNNLSATMLIASLHTVTVFLLK